jgi:hypothetical protein
MKISVRLDLKTKFLRYRAFSSSNERLSNINSIPAAADILYRNPEAIQNRLSLFHHYRLQAQAEIDREMLVGTISSTFHFTHLYLYQQRGGLLKSMNLSKSLELQVEP